METSYYKPELFSKCAEFHGHVCPGLSIGYRAALYAMKLLDLKFSEDEDVVCVTENDACGVDAIQVLLGCSAGKGNMIFHIRGKQAFNFYNRKTGESVRLILKPEFNGRGGSREERMDQLHSLKDEEIFDVKPVTFRLPEEAKIFNSFVCEKCGEVVAESFLRIENGKKICLDCFNEYTRFC